MGENNFEFNNFSEDEKINDFFELSSEIKKYGGIQKFVLLKMSEDYKIGSYPGLSHNEILADMNAADNVEVMGGGIFKFEDNTFIIDTNFKSSKLGPIRIPTEVLKKVMQDTVGDKYKVELSE